jgi:hypothetical protein
VPAEVPFVGKTFLAKFALDTDSNVDCLVCFQVNGSAERLVTNVTEVLRWKMSQIVSAETFVGFERFGTVSTQILGVTGSKFSFFATQEIKFAFSQTQFSLFAEHGCAIKSVSH